MLTLSSVHPMLDGEQSSGRELVDVVLDGTLVRPGGERRRRATRTTRTTARTARPDATRAKTTRGN